MKKSQILEDFSDLKTPLNNRVARSSERYYLSHFKFLLLGFLKIYTFKVPVANLGA